MTSNLNPITWAPLITDAQMAQHLANPAIADGPVLATNPLASRVGWLNINNISSAAFGLPVGFIVMYVVSMMTPAPSKEMQDFIDECRKPKGKTIMDEKSGLVASH
jgi:cation/acetate symporter